MRMSAAGRWLAMSCLVLLAACGGGGGGGGSSSPSLTFDSGSATVNVQYQDSATVTVVATIQHADAITSTVYVDIEDSQRVLTGDVQISEIDATRFSATLHTSPSLGLGHHTGALQVYLCKDVQCAGRWTPSGTALNYDIDVTPAPLSASVASVTSATVHQGGNADAPILIDVQGTGVNWSASTQATWLQVDTTPHSDSSRLTVQYAASAMPVGDYADVVTIKSDDGQTVTVPVALKVIATSFTMDNGVPSFSAVNGAPIAAQPLAFTLDNGVPEPWSLTSSAAWMGVDTLSGTTPAVVTLQPHPEWNALASGDYDDTLTLSSTGLAQTSVVSHLSLIKPTLSTLATATFGGTLGRDMTAWPVSVALDTGTNSYPLSVEAPAWLNVSAPAAVGASGVVATLTPLPAQGTPGSSSATLKLSAHVNGDIVTAPMVVNFNLDQQRLLPSAWAVAFATSPTGTVTSRVLKIDASFGGPIAWTASADAPWLTVTPAGTTGSGSLTLSANASLVPAGASTATVHVSSTTAGVAAADIRVGFWKDPTGLVATTTLPVDYAQLAADKILPYVYAVANAGTGIDVYNAYTAARIATIPNVGSQLSQLSVSADGRRLFALDGISNSVQVVDLTTRTKTGSWPGVNLPLQPAWNLIALRPNGVDLVLLDNGVVLTEGRELPSLVDGDSAPRFAAMSVTEDQKNLVAVDSTLLGYFERLDLDFTVIAGGMFITHVNGANGSGLSFSPVALDPDGHAVYTGAQSRCLILDGRTMQQTGSLPGGAFVTNNIVVTSDHRPVCGSSGWPNDPPLTSDVWVHSAAGAVVQSYKIASVGHALRSRTMVATPDGFVIGVLSDDPLLAFIPIGAP